MQTNKHLSEFKRKSFLQKERYDNERMMKFKKRKKLWATLFPDLGRAAEMSTSLEEEEEEEETRPLFNRVERGYYEVRLKREEKEE